MNKPPLAEVLLELRFAGDALPEFIVAKALAVPEWVGFRLERLPLGDLPAAMRRSDPALSVQPILELKKDNVTLKVGEQVISYHLVQPYPGWPAFNATLGRFVDFLFSVSPDSTVVRCGLRCINLFTKEDHEVSGLEDLAIEMAVAGRPIGGDANLNYIRSVDAECLAMVKIASAGFVIGPNTPRLTALVDIDAYTPPSCAYTMAAEVKGWIAKAHDIVSSEFFSVFTKKMMTELVEKKSVG